MTKDVSHIWPFKFVTSLTGGELFEEIAKEEFILEKDACFYVNQILSAVQHMHSQNIVHLDLKVRAAGLRCIIQKSTKLILTEESFLFNI